MQAAETIAELNLRLEQAAKRDGDGFVLATDHRFFDPATMLHPDGIHTNEVGDRWIAERWLFALEVAGLSNSP